MVQWEPWGAEGVRPLGVPSSLVVEEEGGAAEVPAYLAVEGHASLAVSVHLRDALNK